MFVSDASAAAGDGAARTAIGTGNETGSEAMSVAAIEKVVGRLRWRLRAQTALRHGLLLGAIGLFTFALLVVLVKARVLASDWVWLGGGLAVALPAIGIAIGALTRWSDIALAASLDAAGGLHSRLGSALAFAGLPARTPMQEAAMHDALQVLSQARPASAAPWRWGAFVLGLAALGLAFAVSGPALFVFELPVAAMPGQTLAKIVVPPAFEQDKAEVRKEDERRLEELAKDLEEESKLAGDPTVKQFLDDLNELIRALHEGRLTPEEAAARMAALEKALNEWKEQNTRGAEEVEKRLQEAAEKQKKAHEELTPTLDALEEKDWKAAAEALEKLAEKLDKKELSEADTKKISKDLEQLAKALENERQKEKERLQKERDRLKEKQERDKDRFAKKDKDRLEDTQRQLEQLDDPQQRDPQSEPERQLERLSDELDDAARDMLRRLAEELQKQGQQGEQGEQGAESEQRRQQPGQEGDQGDQGDGQGMTSEDIKRAAEALRKMAQGGQGRQQMRIAQGRMIDVREMMKRGQGGKDGQGKDGQAGKDGKSGEGEDAEGQFEKDAAGGKDGEGKDIMLGGGKPGAGGDMLLLGGKGPPGGMKIPGVGKNGQSDPQLGQGDGIGDGHDKQLLGGEKPSLDFDTKEDFVAGQHGDGPSKEKVVMTAAQKGFASRGYREVHQDYAGVVEDALEKEHIPPGKRTYVRRYFDLIRPR